MKLIDKSALVAETEKRIKETESMQPKFDQFWTGQISAFKGVLKILNTLEVKEVKLDEEIYLWVKNLHSVPNFEELNKFARHFFELGLKAQKGE